MNGLPYRSFSLHAVSGMFILALACLMITSCGGGGGSPAQYNPQAEYNAAVLDASNPLTDAKVSRNLTAIVPGNTNLIWENGLPSTRVLVATWLNNQTACQNYNTPGAPGCKAGQECPNYWYNSWVTVAPELKNLLGSSPTLLRVAQSLGLPPPSAGQTLENTCVVELYVSPANLFRPSPDPETSDHEAEIDFPADAYRIYDDTFLVYSEMPCDARYCDSCTGSGKCGMTPYRKWFTNRRTYAYSQTSVNSPYPWTGLGYTYDWGNPAAPHYGLSEFVINSGAAGVAVFIKSATWTGAYFSN